MFKMTNDIGADIVVDNNIRISNIIENIKQDIDYTRNVYNKKQSLAQICSVFFVVVYDK